MSRNKTETKLKLDLPSGLSSDQKREVALKVIDYINDRTQEGKNVYGRKWSGKAGKYDPDYAKRKGVSKNGPVDLLLRDEMLAAMKYFKSQSKGDQITIGFTKGTKQERKAEGNILGTYGQPSPIPGKARPFLDILKKDLAPIVKSVVEEDKKDKPKVEKTDRPSLILRR